MFTYILSYIGGAPSIFENGGGVIMGAFCVYGISRTVCRIAAGKKTATYNEDEKRGVTPEEWAAARDKLAESMFTDATRRVKISPELDAPQFCRDWLGVDPDHVKDTVIMVRGPKIDKHGNEVKRKGVTVETWLEYAAECERLGIDAA